MSLHLAAHLDVLPTLAELCGVKVPDSHRPDGVSFAPQLKSPNALPKREHLVVQFYGGPGFTEPASPFRHSCVIRDQWRLMNGKELYDLAKDPAQRNDVAASHPNVVDQLRRLYTPHWESVAPRMTPVAIDLGNPAQNPTELCSQDWYMPTGNPPWHFGAIRKLPRVVGPWNVNIRQAGRYRITLRQFPKVANKPVVAVRAKIEIAGKAMEQPVTAGSKGVEFEIDLPAGTTQLVTYLYNEQGEAGGAYFTEVEALSREDRTASRYDGSWESLQKMPVPKWFDDGKIGIFIHWGPYSAIGYRKGRRGYAEHVPKMIYEDAAHYYPYVKERWGAMPPDFGYKDIIPEFRAEKWNPDEWAALFAQVGAKYVVLTAEHHDGWANWDSELTPWNAVDMGTEAGPGR